VNLVYSYSLPWGEKVRDWSPKSGVFHEAAFLGNYHGSDIYLLAGALFCMFLGRYVVRWPRWIMFVLVMAQLFGLAIHQARAMYVGLVVVLILLVLLGETGKSAQFVLMLSCAFVSVLFLTMLGLEIPGRVGPVNMAFLKQNVRSIVGAEEKEGTAGATVASRFVWYDQVFERISRNPVLGEGFGQPLIDFVEEGGATVRQPHNSSVTVLARLGAVGLAIWVAFHLCLIKRYIYAFQQRRWCDKQLSDLLLWLFTLYVISMISVSVEPGLEFPSGAVPFYFFVGLTLGLIRWQVPQKNKSDRRMAAFVPSVEKAL
jgi:O-antigen ligase